MATTYYKLARFEERFMAFRDGKTAYPTEAAARKAAEKRLGAYRISEVPPDGRRRDLEAFDVCTAEQLLYPKVVKQYPAHATRPMGGRPH